MIYFCMEKAKIKKAFGEKSIKFSFLFQLFSLLQKTPDILINLPLICLIWRACIIHLL